VRLAPEGTSLSITATEELKYHTNYNNGKSYSSHYK
jgi:hypothetical protein